MAEAEKLNVGASPEAKGAAKASAAEVKKEHPPTGVRWFRVEETSEIPKGIYGGPGTLVRGKVISSKGYDVDELEKLGVKLSPVGEPGWHKKVQEQARR